jgi:ketosteroid isomerase-like protein
MSQSVATAADTVRDAYAAFGRGDIEAVLGMLADDVEWNVPEVLPHGVTTTGRDGAARFFGRLVELWSDFGLEIDLVTDDGEGRGIGIGRAAGKLRGTETGYGFTHVFTVRDGKVVRFDEYVAPPRGGFPS